MQLKTFLNLWLKKYFSNSQAVLLLILLGLTSLVFITVGQYLTPVLISIIIVYVLQWSAKPLDRVLNKKITRILSYTLFLAVFMSIWLVLVPLLWKQLLSLLTDLPSMLQQAKTQITAFLSSYPEYFNSQHLDLLGNAVITEAQLMTKKIISLSISSLSGVITWSIYVILIPIIVLFIMLDYDKLLNWVAGLFPEEKTVLATICHDIDLQMGNYLRGKVFEILIVGAVSYVFFVSSRLDYALLLGAIVGLSVIIPYVGAIAATVPVLLVAYLQWELTNKFLYLSGGYFLIQFLDGNVLVPILFSEAVNLHPVAIIAAVLVFGSVWGLWGAFLSIPLAILLKTLLQAWPSRQDIDLFGSKAL